MAQRYEEKGIKEGADYGTQFLNAKGGSAPEPPSAPEAVPITDLEEISGGRSVGQIIAFVVAGLAIVVGGFALATIGGGGSDEFSGGVGGDGVDVDSDADAAATTTTTSTTTTTTTTTTTSTTTTTVPGGPTTTTDGTGTTLPGGSTVPGEQSTTQPPATQPPVTQPPVTQKPCPPPGSGLGVTTSGVLATVIGGSGADKDWSVQVSGTASNGTSVAILPDFSFVVNVTRGGSPSSVTHEPPQSGQSIPGGATINWEMTVTVKSSTQPGIGLNPAAYTYTDSSLSHCLG